MSVDKQADALTRVARPSRYLGGELGSICKLDAGIEVRMALAFPDVYEIGMSHLGFPILYNILNSLDWVAAERAYAPWPDMEDWLRDNQEPLRSLESGRSLGDFDIIGFTLQYELSYTNLLTMIQLAGLSLRREQRDESDPLIVVGGPCAYNPEPLAEFFDVALIGDGEEAIVELVEVVQRGKQQGWSRRELLAELAGREGFYVPGLFAVDYLDDGRIAQIKPLQAGYEKVRRRFLADLETAAYPTNTNL